MHLHMKRRTFYISTIALFVIIGLQVILYQEYRNDCLKQTVIAFDNTDDITEVDGIRVFASCSQSWERSYAWEKDGYITGAVFDGVIENNTDFPIIDWSLTMSTAPYISRIDSSWNGEYDVDGEKIHLTPDEYISLVPAHENRTFGCVIYTDNPVEINQFVMRYRFDKDISDYPLFHVLNVLKVLWMIFVICAVVIHQRMRSEEKRRIMDEKIIEQTMMTFANMIDAKDPYTKGHSVRVSEYSKVLGRRMGLKDEDIRKLGYVALLHDCGKMGIPDAVLCKPARLDADERKVIESHTQVGGQVLADFSAIPEAKEAALYHHERYDGKGYPKGLAGEEIPLFARIICVADSFDAMNSDRCYRKHLSREAILFELEDNLSLQFDPIVGRHMIEAIHDGMIFLMDEKIH